MALRTFGVASILVILLSSWLRITPEGVKLATVSKDTVVVREVFSGKLPGHEPERADAPVLLVERPAFAREHGVGSVFRVSAIDGTAQRVQIEYGRASARLIEVMGGVIAGDRIIVSDMSAWDQFERFRLR